VFTLRQSGRLRAVKIGGPKSRVLYPVAALKEFIAANSTQAQESANPAAVKQ
jgi:hypothetical protein